jgi:3-hydroxyacyl-CoA dehydrogenase
VYLFVLQLATATSLSTSTMAAYPIKTVGVIGTGVIGASWTLFFLSKGLRVIAADPAPGAEERLASYLERGWPTMQQAGLEEGASVCNYQFVDNIFNFLDEIDLVQEVRFLISISRFFLGVSNSYLILIGHKQTGPERVDFKRQLFAELDEKAPKHVLLLSSSSGIPSSEFATDCKHNPSRVIIGHPFNPPHLIPLVEVVPHAGTEEIYSSRALDFYRSLGKKPILIKQETPGFIANRLQMALCNEAYSLVSRGIVSAADLGKSLNICASCVKVFTNIVIQIPVSRLDLAFDGQQPGPS